jgi:hypothetical protein
MVVTEDSHNIVSASSAKLSGTNYVMTPDEIGFAWNDIDSIADILTDWRINQDSEIAGTTSLGAVDFTSLFTTDIDGRAREATAAGYAIGCSHGYNLYKSPTYPSQESVLYGELFNDNTESGLWTPALASNYKLNETYGTSGVSETGSLESIFGISEMPSGFSAFDAHTSNGGCLYTTISNGSSYGTNAVCVLYNNLDSGVLGSFLASVGSGNVCGLTNNTEYTLFSKIYESGYSPSYYSDLSSATPTTTSDTTAPSRPVGVVLDAPPEAPNITSIS